ncbi:tripartite tricarboxylate transporter substrate-binding protein [Desulforhopalus singaporensis]|uniref:Tripartite-type tricarboxylate transporter, receptor component TctC n=1 Tax=Desulforhopalus singaporensis TaxID=91360 RepID=A0A1H0KLT3_9BACT|nr:tripartite tricarboxylate transporter substrate-binding protein [Desulforhopalus singaporensis]SDO56732.1 Tripartite-type tricarboxylate transporter, receptor component TctC [Desulforhopalus singaporensis]
MAKKLVFLLTLLVVAGGSLSGMAKAVDFSGETVTWIIPYRVGGGSDVWSRVYSPYLSKYLPGEPTVVVKNMPGAASITGVNYFHRKAKPDGLTAVGSSGSTILHYLLGKKEVAYEFKDYNIVFGSPVDGITYIDPKFGVKSVADVKGLTEELVYASQGATSDDLVALLAYEMLGMKVKAVFGYKGRGAGRVAYEQGEASIDLQSVPAYVKNVLPLVEQGKAVPLFSYGVFDEQGNIVRDPIAPELPSFPEAYEMVHGKKPSGPAWEAWKAFFTAAFGIQKCMWLPKGTPEDVVAAFRKAAQDTLADPEFEKSLQTTLGGARQMVGVSAEKAFNAVLNVPETDKQWLINWLKDRYEVVID